LFFKRIIYILLVLLVAATGFQVVRTFIFTRFISNTNDVKELEEPISAPIPEDAVFDSYLVFSDRDENNSMATLYHIEKVLQYMKIDYDSLDITQSENVDISKYHCIIISLERLDHLKDIMPALTDHVYAGGRLIFAIRPVIDTTFGSISDMLAIQSYSGIDDNATGIRVEEPLILGIDEMEEDVGFIRNSSIASVLDPYRDTVLYLSTYRRTPLLWEAGYGKGKFIVFNGTMLNEKNNRGILTNILCLSRETFIYPVANIKMLHIDDFPAPIPRGTLEPIAEEFNRTIPQFYREVWWSDMIRISKRHDLVYSAFTIENYGDDTTPPFDDPGRIEEENFLVYGKELLNLGGEIAIHGYNHQSLAPEGYIKQDLGYNPWNSQEDMEESLKKLIDFIHSIFPNYTIRAYVPPSNILSDQGRSAVVGAVEDLEVIASVYLPNKEGDVYQQEFEIAPDGIIEFPRISSGYHHETEVMWSIFNGLNTHGIFSHFIHPDDLLDTGRSRGLSWSKLSEEFEMILTEVDEGFSWLRSYSISEAALELTKYLQIHPRIEYRGADINIYCENFRPDAYFIMRCDRAIIETENIEHKTISEDAYLLTLTRAYGSIRLEEK